MTAPAVLLINPRMAPRRNARMPLSLLHLAAVLNETAVRGRSWMATSPATSSARPRASCRRAIMRSSASRSCPGLRWRRRSSLDGQSVVAFPRFPSFGEATFRRCTRMPPSTRRMSTCSCEVRGNSRFSSSSCGTFTMSRRSRPSTASRTSVAGHPCITHLAQSFPRSSCHPLPVRGSRRGHAILAAELPWRTHGGVSGGARLPVPLLVLRCRFDVERRHDARRCRADPCGGPRLARPVGRRLAATLRSQLLRLRGDESAGDRSPRRPKSSVVVLCENRRAGELLDIHLGEAEKSRLKMVYVGAESGSELALESSERKPRRAHPGDGPALFPIRNRTRAVLHVGSDGRPGGRGRETFAYIRRMKAIHPAARSSSTFTVPPRSESVGPFGIVSRTALACLSSNPMGQWGPPCLRHPRSGPSRTGCVGFVTLDAPWLTIRTRRHIRDFARVLACRFPTVQDERDKSWGRTVLRNMARWRYASGRYTHPWELALAQRLVRLREPQAESL